MDEQAYAAAQRKSYAGQESEYRFKAHERFVQFGFQPLGISILGNLIAIADYFGPAVMLAEVSMNDRAPCFSNIRWVRGTMANQSRVRMFPDLYQPGGANRMQAAVVYAPDRLDLLRNGERRLYPIVLHNNDWKHLPEITFPSSGFDQMHSVVLSGDGFVTIESDEAATTWAICDYRGGDVVKKAVPPYRYGLAVDDQGSFFTVSDFRAEQHGLFCNGELIVPDVVGNGIVLLNGVDGTAQTDGIAGALVTNYGQGHQGPFNGVPGSLQYIDSNSFR